MLRQQPKFDKQSNWSFEILNYHSESSPSVDRQPLYCLRSCSCCRSSLSSTCAEVVASREAREKSGVPKVTRQTILALRMKMIQVRSWNLLHVGRPEARANCNARLHSGTGSCIPLHASYTLGVPCAADALILHSKISLSYSQIPRSGCLFVVS